MMDKGSWDSTPGINKCTLGQAALKEIYMDPPVRF
jgi:hypothetical protein